MVDHQNLFLPSPSLEEHSGRENDTLQFNHLERLEAYVKLVESFGMLRTKDKDSEGEILMVAVPST